MVKGKTRATMIVGKRYRDDYSPDDKFSNSYKPKGKKKKKKGTSISSRPSQNKKWVLKNINKRDE